MQYNRNYVDTRLSKMISCLDTFSIPFDFDDILAKYENIKLVKYSTLMSQQGLSYKQITDCFQSKDAFMSYNKKNNNYLIFYNDIAKDFITSNRYRFSIAHEFGHIFLKHAITNPCDISDITYKQIEMQANQFAIKLLCPFISFKLYAFNSIEDIEHTFQISKESANYAYANYQLWLKNRNIKSIHNAKYQHIARHKFDLAIYNKLDIKHHDMSLRANNTCVSNIQIAY